MQKDIVKEISFFGKTWIDIQNPSKKYLRQIAKKYNLHDSDVKECLDHIQIAKTYEHPGYMFIVIHTGILKSHEEIIIEEIDIFFSKRFIITVHNQSLPEINRIFEKMSDKDHSHPHFKKSTVYILHELIRKFTNSNFKIISQIVSEIKKIENKIISANFKNSSSQILISRKNILQIRAITQPNLVVTKEIIKSKIIKGYKNSQVYFDALIESQEKTLNIAQHYRDLIDGLIDISDILTNHRLNEIMRILTIISVSLLPLSLISGIFGMNFLQFGFFNNPYGFFITILGMIILEIIIIQYFKYKKWL